MCDIWRLGCFCANSTISRDRQSRLVLLVDFGSMAGLCEQSRCRMFPTLILVVVVEWLVWVFGFGVVLGGDWFGFVCCEWCFVLLGMMALVGDVVLLLYFGWLVD